MVIENCREVIYVTGTLCANQWPAIKTLAILVSLRYPEGVVIDFSGVRWVSMSGESTLIAAMDDIEQQDLPFALVNLSSSVQTTLTTSVSRRLEALSEARRISLAIFSETWWKRLWGVT
jgi:anti-anti-sigma regulatory factor